MNDSTKLLGDAASYNCPLGSAKNDYHRWRFLDHVSAPHGALQTSRPYRQSLDAEVANDLGRRVPASSFQWVGGGDDREQAAPYGRDQYSFTVELACRPRKDTWVNRIATEYVHRRRWNGGRALDRGAVEVSHVRDG